MPLSRGPWLEVLHAIRGFRGGIWSQGRSHRYSSLALLVLVTGSLCPGQQSAEQESAPSVPPEEIVHRVMEQNKLRSERLKFFCAVRHYHVQYHGLGVGLDGDMHARVRYTPATGKTFEVIDQSGSRLLIDRVLKRLLTTEREDSLKHSAALTPQNYRFTYEGQAEENGRREYVFSVVPKVRNKLLYRGKIWIDAKDYALTKIESQPAVNPSFWIKSTEIEELYGKDGEFWFPAKNRSESKIRMGGEALLTIDYGTYHFDPSQCPAVRNANYPN